MGEMGTIFGSVAARGKLQGDDMMQLLSRGVPVLQLLAEETGKTSAEISDMVTKGEIDFATFERAMRRGMGGAALEAGNTVQGALRNMGAAAGRLGATLAGPLFTRAAGGINGVTSALDAMDGRMKPVMQRFDGWLTSTAVPALQSFGREAKGAFEAFRDSSTVARTGQVLALLGQTAVELAPTIASIGVSLGKASAALGIGTWQVFLTTLEAVGAVASALAPTLESIAGIMEAHPGLVTAAVAAWTGFKTVPGLLGKVTDAVKPQREALSNLRAGVADIRAYYQASGQEISRFSAAMQYAGTSSNSALQAMGRGYTNASAGLMQVSAAHKTAAAAAKANAMQSKSAFTSIDFMAQQAGHSFVASTAKMGAAAKGLAAGGLGVLKSGISGLVGALGGPWGLAFTGAAIAVTTFRNESAKAEEVQTQLAAKSREVSSAQRELKEAVAGTTGALNEQGLAAATKLAKAELTDFMAVGEQASGWMYQWGVLQTDTNMKAALLAKNTGAAYNQLETSLSDMGYSMSDVNQIVANGGPEYQRLIQNLRGSGESGRWAADELAHARREIEQSVARAREMGPAGATMSAALKDIAEQAGTAGDRANKLNRAFMELAGVELTAAEANAELTGVIDSVSQQMDQLAGAALAASGAFDTTTTAGAEAHDAVMRIGDAMRDAVGAGEPAAEVFARTEEALRKVAEQSNMTEQEYQLMLDTYRLTPSQLETTVALTSDEALASLQGVKEKFNNFSGEPVTARVNVATKEAADELTKLGFKVEEFDEKQGTAKVTVDDQGDLEKLDASLRDKTIKVRVSGEQESVKQISSVNTALQAVPPGKDVKITAPTESVRHNLELMGLKIQEIPGSKDVMVHADTEQAKLNLDFFAQSAQGLSSMDIRPAAHLDASGLFLTAEAAKYQLNVVDLARPTPLANMDISQLDARQIEALQKVGLLDGQTPTPAANMNIDQLSAAQQTALSKVFDLASERPTPVADLNNDGIHDGVVEADRWLKGLWADWSGKALSVGMSVVRSIKDVFTSEGRAAGGVVGSYATGGRLPVGAPGSHTTDGILGVDAAGMPTARVDAGEWVINRRSSSKYNGLLDAINRDDPRLAEFKGRLPGYADGGVVTARELKDFAMGLPSRGYQMNRSLDGAPYTNSPADREWGDCSSSQGHLAAFGLGLDPYGRKFSTVTQLNWLRSNGANIGPGPSGTFRIGWYDNGGGQFGHTSGTLPDGTNIEMGGGNGGGAIGRGAAAWDDPQFTHHAWIPTINSTSSTESLTYGTSGSPVPSGGIGNARRSDGDKQMVPLSDKAETVVSGGGASTWSDLSGSVVAALVGGQVADVLGVLGIPNELPPIIRAGQQWFQQATKPNQTEQEFAKADQAIVDAGESVAEAESSEVSGADSNVASTEPTQPDAETLQGQEDLSAPEDVKSAVKKALSARGWDTGAEWDTIDFIVSHESNWDPNAVNPSSGAFGLFQLNPASGTLQQYMPDKSTDPAVQAEAGARYIEDRYGSPVKAQAFWEANHWYDKGGRASGIGHMLKNTLKPERVLSPEQTKAFEDLVYTKLPMLSDAEKQAEPGDQQQDGQVEIQQPPAPEDGAASSVVDKALPMLMDQVSLADTAKMLTTSAVGAAGSAVTSAATSGLSALGAEVPGLGMLAAPLASGGDLATNAASWYAGEVAWGVTNAFEQYGKELVGATLKSPFQELSGLVHSPLVGDLTAQAESFLPPAVLSALVPPVPQPVGGAAGAGGDTFNFYAQSREGMYSDFRREQAKRSKGAIGAR